MSERLPSETSGARPLGRALRLGFAVLGIAFGISASRIAGAQTTYTWNRTNSAPWTTATNWTPSRTSPQSSDILVVNGSTTPNPTITTVPTQTIGRLRVINNANVTFTASSAATITITGGAAPNFDVVTGSVTISGSTAIKIQLGTNATASIAAPVTLSGGAHQLLGANAGSIVFASGGSLTTGSSFTGNPFGNSGTANQVVFQSGSSYTHTAGSDVFGLTAPSSKVTYQSGSTAFYRTATGFAPSGRTYANLTVQSSTALTGSGTGDFQVNNLTLESGSSFSYTGSSTATVRLNGNVTSAGNGGITLTGGSGGIVFATGATQTIGGGGGSGAITFGSNATIPATTTVAVARSLSFSAGTMTVNGTFRIDQGGGASGSTGFVYAAGSSLVFNNTSGSLAVSSGSVFWPAVNGPATVTVQGAGGITMNSGATRTVSGVFQTAGPVTGGNLLTFPGTNQLNAGGSFSSSPTYSGTATLVYATGMNVGNEWGAGTVVGSGVPSNVTIQAGAGTVSMPNTDRTVPGNLLVTSGTLALNASTGNLFVGGNWTDNGAVTVNGRLVTFNGAANQTITRTGGETFANLAVDKSAGSLLLGANVTVTGASGDVLRILNAGAVDLNGNTLTLSGAGGNVLAGGTSGTRTITGNGLLAITGAKTVTNASSRLLTLANARTTLAAAVNFGASLTTVNGILEILAGGSVTPNSPAYATGSTLRYNTGGSIGRGVEWSATSGPGYPHHVEVTGNTTLDLGSGGAATARQLAGNLTVVTGSTLTLNGGANPMTAALTVLGNATVDGTLALSSLPGGNLGLAGNLAVTGTLTANSGGLLLQGGALQTLNRTGGLSVPFVQLAKSGNSVQLLSDLTATSTGAALTMNGSVDVLDLNGKTLTLSGTLGGTDASGSIKGGTGAKLVMNGTGSAGTLRLTSGSQALDQLTLNRTSGSVTLGTPLTVNTSLVLTEGAVITGTNTLTMGPSAAVSRTNGFVNGKLAKRIATGATAATFEIGSTAGYAPVSVQFGSVTVAGDLTASTTEGDHPQLAGSGINAGRSVNRWYTLAGSGLTFTTYSATFNFRAAEVDAGAATGSFEVRRYVSPSWFQTTPGTAAATSTAASGIAAFGDFAVGELVDRTITASAGANGAISPSGAVIVKDGKNRTFSIVPDEGYHVVDVLVDGASVGTPTSYTFTNVVANHTIATSFAINHYTLTVTTSGEGTAVYAPVQPDYTHGTFVNLTATAAQGWDFVNWDAGDFTATDNPLALRMEATRTVTAVFVRSSLKYTRSTFTAAYAPLTVGGGATMLMSADDSTRSIPMPFPFIYSGLTFTTSNFLAVNANGFVFPSRTSVTQSLSAQANNNNLYTSTSPNATIAPWYDDLSGLAVGSNPAGNVLYRVQGAAGSRSLTVQWTDVSSYSNATSGQPRRVNFQAVLYEGTNVIEFRYGSATGSTFNTLESASIGLEDSLGGVNNYFDAVVGSRVTYNGMLTTNKWPVRNLRFTPGTPAPLAGGSYDVGSGGTYPSLSEAAADLNHRGVSGAVTLRLLDAVVDSTATSGNNVFPILFARVAGTSASNTITLRPAGATTTIKARGTDNGTCGNQSVSNSISNVNEPVLGLVGTDWMTIRDLTLEGGPLADRGLLVLPSSTADGAQNNTVRDLTVRLVRTNASTVGIQQIVPAAPTSASGANSFNKYDNLNVSSCYAGVSLAGNSNIPDEGCEIGVLPGGTTTIGGASAGDLGGSTSQTFGIRATNQKDVSIFGAEVRNLLGTGTGTVDGILLDNLGTATFSSGTCQIFRNKVHGLDNTNGSAGRVTGIRVNLSANAASVSRVYDNFVYGLNSSSTSTVSRRIAGILLQDAAGGAGATHQVDWNSVRIAPSTLTSPNTCFEIGTASGPVVKVRNNVFANFVGTQSGSGKHYCWVTPGADVGPAGSVSDRNVLHINNVANGYTGLANSTDRVTLADWQAATSQDVNSSSSNPQFVSDVDLHINTSRPTPVEARASTFGGAISWVTTDIDGDSRNASTPDVGADEGAFNLLVSNDMAAAGIIEPADGNMKIAGTSFVPQATYENSGINGQNNVPVRFKILGPLPATTVVYDQSTTIPNLAAGTSQAVTFPSVSLPGSGFYTVQAIVSLALDQNHGNDQISAQFENAGPLSGTYSVGAGQSAPFNTLTAAVTRLNTVGVSGPVTLQLVDPAYGPSESFPINVNAYTGASAANRVTIRPAPAVDATLTGATSRALIVLNGADYVTLDGSNTVGGTTRNLTLTNNDPSAASAVVWGQTSSGNPVTNCVVQNVVLIGSGGTQTLVGVGFAGSTIGMISGGQGNHGNTVDHCLVKRVQFGIYSSGFSAASKNNGTVIRRNNVDASPPDNVSTCGILARFEDNLTVTENVVADIVTGQSVTPIGIALGLTNIASDTFLGDEVTNATVTRNRIDHVESTNGNGLSAVGLSLAPAASGVTTIANNMISRVTSPAFDPDMTAGIELGGGAGSVTRLYFNSVSMTGARGNASSASFALAIGGTNPTVDLRDNVLMNTQTTTGPGTAYAIGLNYSSPYTNLTSNYNDLWTGGPALAVVGALLNEDDSGNRANLAAWRSETGKDGNSVSSNPVFVSTSDLHIRQSGSPAANAGTPVGGITVDWDGEPGRRATTPDMGADEFETFTLTLNTVGPGTITKNPNQPNYVSNDQVQLTAVPSAGYHFTSWSVDASGSTNPLTVTMNANKSITATFAINTYTLNVTTTGTGTVTKSPNQATYNHGTTVSLTPNAGTGYTFANWTGDATGNVVPLPVTMDANKNIGATFAINTYTLTVNTVGNGAVGKTPDQPTYNHGSSVTLTATPAPGSHFVSWSGGATGTTNPIAVTITANTTVTATFAPNQYTLNVSATGSGSVAKAPDQPTYAESTVVQLTATPAAGYHFTSWGGDASGSANPLALTMTANRNVTATFDVDQHPLDVSTIGHGVVNVSPDQETYAHGSTVQLTAVPEPGHQFLGWSGDTSSTQNPLTLTMNGSRNVVATFTHAVSVTTIGNGSVSLSPNQSSYAPGTTIQLTATPSAGQSFVDWVGDAEGSSNPLSLLIDEDKIITARFTFSLATPVVGSGTVARSPLATNYAPGTAVQLTATPATGQHFVAWSGDASGSQNPLTISMDANTSITATFAVNTYALTLAKIGAGAVAASPQQATYNHGSTVTVTATPDPGHSFVSWAGDASGSTNPLTLTMDAAKSVTARFTTRLDVTVTGNGTVAKSPNQTTYAPFSSVTLTATPATGNHFVSWGGDTSGSTNPLAITMRDNRSISAAFAINTYPLVVTINGSGTVAKSPNQAAYDHGTIVALTPTPATGWHFVGWSGDATGNASPLNVTMDAAKNVTATFAINTYTLTATAAGNGTVGKNPNQAAYDHGTSVTLTATPNVGSNFLGWSGDTTGSTNPLVLTLTGNRAITANFADNTYALDVTVAGSGSVGRSPDQASYAHGSTVTLTAAPAAGWHFVGWSGGVSGSTNPVSVLMDGPKTVTATFAINTYSLSVGASGSGTVGKSPDQASYDHGTVVTLTPTPATGWHFTGWSGDASGSQNPLPLTMNGNKTVTASFAINTYTLDVSASGNGTVAKSPDQATYDHGTAVTVTATPATGYHLQAWSGAASGSTNPLPVTMDANKTITGTFVINTYPLGVMVSGSGTVAKSPDQPTYDHGTTVSLTPTPAAGWHFVGWSGDASGSTVPLVLTMTAAKNVTATFALNTYPLTVSVTGSGSVTKNPDQAAYDHGTSVTLTAVPAVGWHFVAWSGDATGGTNPVSVSMTAAKSVTATFAINTYTLALSTTGNGTAAKSPDQATYDHGTIVQITPTPGAGWHFTSWSGSATGSANPLSLVMDGNKTVTANFAINTYPLDVTVTGSGTVAKSPNQAAYDHGTVVLLSVTPGVGYHFVGWSGDASGSSDPVAVTMDGPKQVTATFALNTYTLSLATTGNGTAAKSPDQATYGHGTAVTLTATPAAGSHFAGWSGDASGTTNPLTLTMESDQSITANFEITTYTLDVTSFGNGTVTRAPDQALYNAGTTVTLTAVPANGYHLVGWGGDATGNANPLDVPMDANKVVTATFAINTYTLDIVVSGGGSVAKSPDQPTYDHGTSVTLTATPDPGWHFVSWSGALSGSINPISLTMLGNRTVNANFALNTYTLSVGSNAGGTVSRNPNQATYVHGTGVVVTALPNAGYHFTGWSGDSTATDNPLPLTMLRNRSLVASFLPNQYVLDVSAVHGTVTKSPDQPTYAFGSTVQLTAVPDSGYHFRDWIGDAQGTTNPITITMNGPRNVTARFGENTVTLTVLTQGGTGVVQKFADLPRYDLGTKVDVKLTPDAGYQFSIWKWNSGADTVTANPVSVTLDSSVTLVATLVAGGPPVLVTSVVGQGTVSRSPDQASYPPGTTVTLTATPAPQWRFSHWSGDRFAVGNPCDIFMDRDKTITATFVPDGFTLDVTTIGPGTVAKSPDQLAYATGAIVQLTASPQAGYHVLWGGDASGTANPITVTMDTSRAVTATFGRLVTVAVTGTGTVQSSAAPVVLDGTVVTLTATPGAHQYFTGWSGDTAALSPKISFAVHGDKNLTANFGSLGYRLDVTTEGSGTATRVPDQASYAEGSSVELRAMPDAGWHFVGWTEGAGDQISRRGRTRTPGASVGSQNPLVVTMTADRSITAVFALGGSSFTVATEGAGVVLEQPTTEGEAIVELHALANAGWRFASWSGDATGADAALRIDRTIEARVIARFEKVEGTDSTTIEAPVRAAAAVVEPLALAIARLTPNPTRGAAAIELTLPRAGAVRLVVLDAQGREVARLADGTLEAGRRMLVWNGLGPRGQVPAGVYFVKLTAGAETRMRRLVIAR